MVFKRKAYGELLKWKKERADRYSILLEGARRVGKSTIAEEFARNEYDSYILIDFANTTAEIKNCFDDISDLDRFFLRLQTSTGVSLVRGKSAIVFDEVQLFPQARQATKYLVQDGRYHYISTGSLISIKKNVKDILIPSEEMSLPVYPMDYEEFFWATGNDSYDVLRELYKSDREVGQEINRRLMRDFRIYMAVGGMPQAVATYIEHRNFTEIDAVKREILRLYEDDFKKIDPTGRISAIYGAIPAQLARGGKRYILSGATGKKTTTKDEELLYELIDSKTALISYDTMEPQVGLSATRKMDGYKLYMADTGLFVTYMFRERPETENVIYNRLMSDKLPANLGYLYENIVAQMIRAGGRELYYHTWEKKGSTHYYETDFLLSSGTKLFPIEVKSSGTGKHESILRFCRKYSKQTAYPYLLSQKDVRTENGIKMKPLYMLPFILEEL